MEENNPFSEEFQVTANIAGFSSQDLQRRVHVLGERTKYLLELILKQDKEIAELKEIKQSVNKARARRKKAETEAK